MSYEIDSTYPGPGFLSFDGWDFGSSEQQQLPKLAVGSSTEILPKQRVWHSNWRTL
jgi:hypothetical protein